MAKRDTLRLSAEQYIETGKDYNGRYYIAYSKGASVFIRDTKELIKWLKVPKSIPMRQALDSWLASLGGQDAEQPASAAPLQELMATGFGPECHLDESDPNHNTRTVI